MVIELRVVQFWSEIILVISNRTRAARSFDFEITRMISDQIALHSVQLPLLTCPMGKCFFGGNSNYRRTVINPVNQKMFWGYNVEMTCGLVHASYSLPEWQAVKLTFFAPYILSASVWNASYSVYLLLLSLSSSGGLGTSNCFPACSCLWFWNRKMW